MIEDGGPEAVELAEAPSCALGLGEPCRDTHSLVVSYK
jgi:hypothetical protein